MPLQTERENDELTWASKFTCQNCDLFFLKTGHEQVSITWKGRYRESWMMIIATYLLEVFQESGEVCRIGADRGWAVSTGPCWDALMAALPTLWSIWCMSQCIASMGLSVKSLLLLKLHWTGFRAGDLDACLSLSLHIRELHAEPSAMLWPGLRLLEEPRWLKSLLPSLSPDTGTTGHGAIHSIVSFAIILTSRAVASGLPRPSVSLEILKKKQKQKQKPWAAWLAFPLYSAPVTGLLKMLQLWLTSCRIKANLPALEVQCSMPLPSLYPFCLLYSKPPIQVCWYLPYTHWALPSSCLQSPLSC